MQFISINLFYCLCSSLKHKRPRTLIRWWNASTSSLWVKPIYMSLHVYKEHKTRATILALAKKKSSIVFVYMQKGNCHFMHMQIWQANCTKVDLLKRSWCHKPGIASVKNQFLWSFSRDHILSQEKRLEKRRRLTLDTMSIMIRSFPPPPFLFLGVSPAGPGVVVMQLNVPNGPQPPQNSSMVQWNHCKYYSLDQRSQKPGDIYNPDTSAQVGWWGRGPVE